MRAWENREREDIGRCVAHRRGGFWEPVVGEFGDFVPPGVHLVAGAECEDRPNRRCDELGVCFRDLGEQVPRGVDAATLTRRALEAFPDRGDEPVMRVGDHESDPAQAPVSERTKEPGPERFIFAVADIDTEGLSVAVRV